MTTLSWLILGMTVGYLLVSLALGWWSSSKAENTADDYFLANRAIGPVVLFFTLIATNFSAFFFLGFAGMGYRVGYSFYGIMSLGTAFVGLSFYVIGHKAWVISQKHTLITPSELIEQQLPNRALKLTYLTVMVVFTMPYLALQPIGVGYLLQRLTNGQVPYFLGALLLTICVVVYVFIGGMRSVAWTDVLQGVMMLLCMFLAVWFITQQLGGMTEANAKVAKLKPELFSRQGTKGFFTPKIWFSLMILWFLSVPMFPHMMMRFFTPKKVRSLKISAITYPLVTMSLFLCPIVIGVLGHLAFPDIMSKKVSDQILPMMLMKFSPEWLTAFVMLGALAAMMSTLDSQLLALSTMLTRDVYLGIFRKDADVQQQVKVGRFLIILLAVGGLAIAYSPPATIFQIAKAAFTGLAVLFPTTLAALYWSKTHPLSCLLSILVGEALVLLVYFGGVKSWTMGFAPVIPIVALAFVIIGIGSLLLPARQD